MKIKLQFKRNIGLFYLAYGLYFVSLIIPDLVIQFDLLIKLTRYSAYFLFIIGLLQTQRGQKDLIGIGALFIVVFIISLMTKDNYWSFLFIVILSLVNIEVSKLFKLSYEILSIVILLVIMLTMVGLLPNVMTNRIGEDTNRFALGFYHSNVLPLAIFYLIAFRMLGNQFYKKKESLFWLIVSVIVFHFCRSKNGIVCTLLVIGLYNINDMLQNKKIWRKINLFLAKNIGIICSVFSFIMVYMQDKNNYNIWVINNMFSGRFAIAYHYLDKNGISFISTVPKEQYIITESVIDNGYLYVALRYGFLFLILYFIIFRLIAKKYSNNTLILGILSIVEFANMIDNDLFSYGVLPIVIIAFSHKTIKK